MSFGLFRVGQPARALDIADVDITRDCVAQALQADVCFAARVLPRSVLRVRGLPGSGHGTEEPDQLQSVRCRLSARRSEDASYQVYHAVVSGDSV